MTWVGTLVDIGRGSRGVELSRLQFHDQERQVSRELAAVEHEKGAGSQGLSVFRTHDFRGGEARNDVGGTAVLSETTARAGI